MTNTYPAIDPREWRELERQAGRPLSLSQAHAFRRRQLTDRALESLLASKSLSERHAS
jgi:hypothetical protein